MSTSRRAPRYFASRLLSSLTVFAITAALVPFAGAVPAAAATIVVPPGTGLGAAIAGASAGSVIVLSEGEYTTSARIVIDKPLTIVGAGKDLTVVRSTTNTTFPVVHNGETGAWISVRSTGSLTISDLTLDGGRLNAVKTGVALYARGAVSARDIHVTNTSYQLYYGFGMMLIGPGHTVDECTFSEIERVSLYHAGGSQDTSPPLDPSIEYSLYVNGCDFTGSGPGLHLQYGLETERGGRTLAEGCSFYGFSGLDSGWESAAAMGTSFRPPYPTEFTVNDSSITSCVAGIDVGYSAQTTDTITSFSRNTFSDVPWDVVVFGDEGVISLPSGTHNIDLDDPDAVGEAYEYFEWWQDDDGEWEQVLFDPSLIADFWNRAPVAEPDAYATGQAESLVIDAPGVLGNDTDANSIDAAYDAALADAPANGSVLLDADGAFVYVPEESFVGTDTFTYTVTDGYERSLPGTVTIAVVNVAPVAVDDAYTTPANTTLMKVAPGVLANDIPGDADPMTPSLASMPPNGTVFLAADGSFGYVPDPDYVGIDAFTYTVSDGFQVSAPATVTITVTAPEEPPVRGVIRVWGEDRYETNVEASLEAFPEGADAIVVATGANWPDALGGAALAGTVDGPLLLTTPASLPAGVQAEIVRLGATKAYVLGGPVAVSEDVEAELGDLLGAENVVRLEGEDRYGTAREVADEVIALLGSDYSGTALVATGGNFPDALAGSPLAAAKGWPILLAHPLSDALYVPAETTATIIMGGASAVSSAVEDTLVASLGADAVERVGGENRYDTAARIAARGTAAALVWDGVGIATGENFPDALSAGAMLGALDTVLLLTPSDALHAETEAALSAHKAEIDTVHILGGVVAIADEVEAAVGQVLEF